jgi:glutamate/tyrosine decarboxylase-like PLP-dependent enzyme
MTEILAPVYIELTAMTKAPLPLSKCSIVLPTAFFFQTTSGGTESLLLAGKTYRDWAKDEKGIIKPEM